MAYKKFSDIYSKQELIDNNWKFAHVEISTHAWSDLGEFTVIKKFDTNLSENDICIKAKDFIKLYFENHPEYDYNEFCACYTYGDCKSGTTSSISLYHLLGQNKNNLYVSLQYFCKRYL